MKLGVSFMVFDGEELLEHAARAIRPAADFISVVYQTTSYFGNKAGNQLVDTVDSAVRSGLVDEAIHASPDLGVHHKHNELRYRNIGLEASRASGCTHHLALDADEFLFAAEVEVVKRVIDAGDYDVSFIGMEVYYGQPNWQVRPNQGLESTFIHPVDNDYDMAEDPIYRRIEQTRRLRRHDKPLRVLTELAMMHHMSWVRKDIRKKLANSDTGAFLGPNGVEQICSQHDSHRLGGKFFVPPDFRLRRTVDVGDCFGVPPFSSPSA